MDAVSFAAAFAFSREPGHVRPSEPERVAAAPEEPKRPMAPLHDDVVFPEPPSTPPVPPRDIEFQPPALTIPPASDAARTTSPADSLPGSTAPPSMRPVGAVSALPATRPRISSWSLADRFGTVWTHADKAHLERWVAARNAAFAPRPYYLPAYGCPGGRCPR